ncbi:MAG TPA: hypothetical protein VHC41_06820, partial [Mycobacteriales bacterium]|nr:hypothetical protein [Mycobacteriales bacterium]
PECALGPLLQAVRNPPPEVARHLSAAAGEIAAALRAALQPQHGPATPEDHDGSVHLEHIEIDD